MPMAVALSTDSSRHELVLADFAAMSAPNAIGVAICHGAPQSGWVTTPRSNPDTF